MDTREVRDRFEDRGFHGPVPLLSPRECRKFLEVVQSESQPRPMDWPKGHAPVSRAFYEIATYPAILDPVQELLGSDVLLWGASIQSRRPGQVHAWHTDIEVTDPESTCVAVWVGLAHTDRDSSLVLVPGSQRFETIQEVRAKSGAARERVSDADIDRWARERDQSSGLTLVEMTDGEALFFDGRMWHGSNNLGRETRHALLLQFSTPTSPIRLPDLNRLDWPFHRLEVPRPACILVRGRSPSGINRIVTAPVRAGSARPELSSQIRELQIPLPEDHDEPWKPTPLFGGTTADIDLSCHVSMLRHGHSPHPPHAHEDEEILVVLRGEVEVELPQLRGGVRRLRAGELVHYPAGFAHTLKTLSSEPANYLMFKWTGSPISGSARKLGFEQHDLDAYLEEQASGFVPRVVFEGPTSYLRKLQVHATTLGAGAGYEPHIDAHDVAIVVLEGEVETLGQRVGAYDAVFYRAGEAHGMRNPTDRVAKYLVVEFHGSQTDLSTAIPPRPSPSRIARRIAKKVLPDRAVSMLRRSRWSR